MLLSDIKIINTINQNPEKGFFLLMSEYKEKIYWHIRRIVVSHCDAQDVTQETFIRVFRSIKQFNGNSSLKTWIYKIATHEAIRLLDKNKKESLLLELPISQMENIIADEYVTIAIWEE